MTKRWLIALLAFGVTLAASSQTLFTYGKNKADAKDFLRAYNKNNTQPTNNKAKAMRDYLDLYINSRLKIEEAHARGYDTLPQIKSEVENLRAQIIDNYMSDPNAITRLTKEAFQRSLKDIHVAHIFIAFDNPPGTADSSLARKKLDEVLARLGRKEDFLTVAQQLSDDPAAKTNKGDIGFVTVYTLPYEFENVVYATAPGTYSKPYTSRIGYHIFKNIEERKAIGRMKIQQILLAFPPNSNDDYKARTARLADSLYERIVAGDDFGKLASQFSNDYVSAATGGNIPDVSVGQFDPAFEKLIWSLPKDGAISKPVLTSYGYHIVKRISTKPVVTDPNDKDNNDELKQKTLADDRWKTARDFIYDRVKKKAGFRKADYKDAVLWAFSDSMLDYKPGGIGRAMNMDSPVFKIGDSTVTAIQWIGYAQSHRFRPDRSGTKSYPVLMDEFSKQVMYDYYRTHLEEFSDEFRIQMNEFRDGNLFFEIMQQEIWNKTQNDSDALVSLYRKNKAKYIWKPSADAIVFFSAESGVAKALRDELQKDPARWKKALEQYTERAVTDSARYEWAQIPGLGSTLPKAGMLTPLSVNSTDNSSSFAYILKVYPETAPRNFNEAKGLVMNDYQADLEKQWIKKLRNKYPVRIDEKVFEKLAR